MNYILLNTRHSVAKKVYYDDGMDRVWENLSNLTFAERMYFYRIKKKRGYKIQIGEKYVRQVSIFDGDFDTFRTIPKFLEIIEKYKLKISEKMKIIANARTDKSNGRHGKRLP